MGIDLENNGNADIEQPTKITQVRQTGHADVVTFISFPIYIPSFSESTLVIVPVRSEEAHVK